MPCVACGLQMGSLLEALHKAAAGGIAARSLRREAPAPPYDGKGGLALQVAACFAGRLDKLCSSFN